MTDNFDGVWEMRIFYSVDLTPGGNLPHRMTFDLDVFGDPAPGTAPADVIVNEHDGTTPNLATWMATGGGGFMDVLLACFGASASFGSWELWKIPEGTFDATFITSASIAATGTAAGANQIAMQQTLTFRSIGGGIMRLQLMESAHNSNVREVPPYSNVAIAALSDFVVSGNSAQLARDNTKPFVALAWSGGQNEVIWRKRFRPR